MNHNQVNVMVNNHPLITVFKCIHITGEGECVRVKERLDDNQLLKPQTLYQKGSGWLSSSKECNDIFTYHFNGIFLI